MKRISLCLIIIEMFISANLLAMGQPVVDWSAAACIEHREAYVRYCEKSASKLETLYSKLLNDEPNNTDLQIRIDAISVNAKLLPMPYINVGEKTITYDANQDANVLEQDNRIKKCEQMIEKIEMDTRKFAREHGLKYPDSCGPMY